jgi:hypothetical protein
MRLGEFKLAQLLFIFPVTNQNTVLEKALRYTCGIKLGSLQSFVDGVDSDLEA